MRRILPGGMNPFIHSFIIMAGRFSQLYRRLTRAQLHQSSYTPYIATPHLIQNIVGAKMNDPFGPKSVDFIVKTMDEWKIAGLSVAVVDRDNTFTKVNLRIRF
jgi:hypothetical protein